jgi:uncharacterized protein (TIGR02145 family)
MKKLNLFLSSVLMITLLVISCKKEQTETTQDSNKKENVKLPTLTTIEVTSITETSAKTGGSIIGDSNEVVTQRGVVWSTSPNPTIVDTNKTNDGSGVGNFISTITGLTGNTKYYVRAYATNSAGTAYGNELSFTTSQSGGGGIVTNPGAGVTFDGYNYSSIVLGNGQEWMAENLRTTSYANGDPIPNVSDATQWRNLTTGAWAHYDNDNPNESSYGKLYNWYAVSDSRNMCPTGWRVPSDSDWTDLINYLGGAAVAGGKMKSVGSQYWQSPNTSATDESGFSGLPGGYRTDVGDFITIRSNGNWWSSTELHSNYAWYYLLNSRNGIVSKEYNYYRSGLSVRCIKD